VVLDDDAVRKLIRRCRDEDPTATEDEVAAFLNVKILQLRNSPARNMVGMLLSAVPAYFAKPATELAMYRQQKAEERAKHLQIAHEVLEDPESSPESRQWAQDLIFHQGRELNHGSIANGAVLERFRHGGLFSRGCGHGVPGDAMSGRGSCFRCS